MNSPTHPPGKGTAPSEPALSVLLIDPSPFNRSCILAGLAGHGDLDIRGFGDIPDDENIAAADIIIISGDPSDRETISLPLQLEHLRKLAPKTPIIMMGDTSSLGLAGHIASTRVNAMVTGDTSPDHMNYIIRLVATGLSVFPGSLIDQINLDAGTQKNQQAFGPRQNRSGNAHHPADRTRGRGDENNIRVINPSLESTAFAPLTPRQRDVLRYLAMGYANKVIARKLSISESTVKVHIRAIMEQVGVTNRTQIVAHFLAQKTGGNFASRKAGAETENEGAEG